MTKWWHSLLTFLIAGLIGAGLTLMHLLEISILYTTPIEAGLTVGFGVLGLILYFQSSDARLKRRAISTLFGLAALILAKLVISQGIDFLGKFGGNIPTENGQPAEANGLVKAVMQTDWRVDCLLAIVAFGLCVLATQLILEGRKTMKSEEDEMGGQKPLHTWDALQTTKGCKQYLISQVESPDNTSEEKIMRGLLTDCLLDTQTNLDEYLKSHKLGKKTARGLLFKALGKFIKEFKHIEEVHGNLLRSLEQIRIDIDKLGGFYNQS